MSSFIKGDSTQKAKMSLGIAHAAPIDPATESASPFPAGGSDVMAWFWSLPLFQKVLLLAGGFLFAGPFGTNKILVVSDLFVGDGILLPAAFLYLLVVKSSAGVRRELFGGLKGLSFIVLFLLFLLGIVTTKWDFIAPFTDLRCASLVLSFYYLCSSKDETIRVNAVYSALIMTIISLLSNAVFYQLFPDDDGNVKNYYPSYGLFLLAIVAVYEKKPFIAILGFILSVYIAATSFYRSLMFVPIIFFLILVANFFRDIRQREKSSHRNALIIGSFFLAGILSSGFLANRIVENFNSNEGTVEQGVTKMNNLIGIFQGKGLGEGDDLRAEYLTFLGSHLFSFIVPSGFGHKVLIGHWGPAWTEDSLDENGSNSLDGMHLFFACHFGLLLSILILGRVFVNLSNALLQTRGGQFGLRLLILSFIFADSLVTASAFELISNAVFCGATIGCLSFVRSVPKGLPLSRSSPA